MGPAVVGSAHGPAGARRQERPCRHDNAETRQNGFAWPVAVGEVLGTLFAVTVVDLPEADLVRVARWCAQKIPERARCQVRMEHEVRGRKVTIVERRAPWDDPLADESKWTSRSVAQLRHAADGWRLYWPDSNTRWHLVGDVPAAPSVMPLLEAVDDPGRAFLG